ncbi:MAG: hypothetical protein ACK53L_18500, partial [Pirellulaceae bacterium]
DNSGEAPQASDAGQAVRVKPNPAAKNNQGQQRWASGIRFNPGLAGWFNRMLGQSLSGRNACQRSRESVRVLDSDR